MAITPLPVPPSRSAPLTFSTLANAFLSALPTFATEANATAEAMNLNDTSDTSASSITIGTGAKTFTVTAGKSFLPGMSLKIARTSSPSNWMYGDVTTYSTNQLVMNIINIQGSGGPFTDWTISFASSGHLLNETAETTGFTITGGTTPETLTVTANTSLDEAAAMSSKAPKASPIFTTQITTPVIYGSSAADGDITIEGTSSATKTTSYVVLQPTGGNVGIRTTGPSTPLDVQGIITTRSAAPDAPPNATEGLRMAWDSSGADTTVLRNSIFNEVSSTANAGLMQFRVNNGASTQATVMSLSGGGNVGIGTIGPNYKLEIVSDSAGKPGTGGLWTVVSDERIKAEIELADLDRCYEIIKSVPLKRFAWADGVYTKDQVRDRHNLGWIAQDVQKMFAKAVGIVPFTKAEKILDGQEEYEEQEYIIETVKKEETSIEIRDGKPVQVKKMVKKENKVMLFDTFDVVDEHGSPVMNGDEPLTYQVPKMIKKTRPKFRQDVIEDCLDLNNGQLYAAMYGCIQKLMQKVEALESQRSL